jgi:hypothetical protein
VFLQIVIRTRAPVGIVGEEGLFFRISDSEMEYSDWRDTMGTQLEHRHRITAPRPVFCVYKRLCPEILIS